jgi:hypothetical protein
MRTHLRSRFYLALAAMAMVLGLSTCTADSPTEPQQQPAPSGGGTTTPSTTWNITITSSRPQLEVNGTRSTTLTIRVRDSVTNALPPDGAVVLLSTSLGEFGALGSGAMSAQVALLQGVAQILLFAGDEAGTAVVTARLESSFGQLSIPFVVTPTPPDATPTPEPDIFFLDQVVPDEGGPEGGYEARILGQHIECPVRVFFGPNPADVLSVSASQIRVRVPRNDNVPAPPAVGRLPVDVIVTINTNGSREQTDTLVSGFTYVRGDSPGVQPVIFSVTPNVGPNEGGTRVTINGDGFQSPVQVTFERGSAVLEAQLVSVSRTQIVAVSPPAVGFGNDLRNQQVDLRVKNSLNGLQVVSTNAFRYGVAFAVFAADPSAGPFEGGTRVTIFGEGFDEPLVVDFGSLRQQVLSVTGNQILVRTVALAVNGVCQDVSLPVRVTHLETNQTAQGGSFTYLVEQFAPAISSTSPSTLSQSPGVVTINGTNFRQQIQVTFDERPVIVNSITNTQIVANFPSLPSSSFDSEACDDNGDNFEGERFVVTPFELVVTDLVTGCSDALSVNVTPNDQSCRNDIAPTPTPTTVPPSPTPTVTPTSTPLPP